MTSIYKTAQGKQVDMHKLMMQNELTLAVGNMKVNARGDAIGPGGYVVKKNENSQNTTVTPNQIRPASIDEDVSVPTETVSKPIKTPKGV